MALLTIFAKFGTGIIGIAGEILCILGCVDIIKSKHKTLHKVIFCILLLVTNWLGVAVHYLYGKKRL